MLPFPELPTLTQCHLLAAEGPSLPHGFTFHFFPGTWGLVPSGKVWETLKHLPGDGPRPPAASRETSPYEELGSAWAGGSTHPVKQLLWSEDFAIFIKPAKITAET